MKRLLLLFTFSSFAFAQVNVSPDMNLPIPIPGVTSGPNWATDIVASLNQIDSHNHSFGQGVQIQPNGLDISSDLSFLSNNATALRSVIFTPQSAPLAATSPDVGSIYVAGNELYYNDATGGHQVKITTNGSVNAGAGSITGLPSGTAGVSYAGGTYTFQSATNTSANIDAGSYILRNATASSKGITLQPTLALAADYSITLPTLPAATSFLTMDTLGNINANINTTGGITNAMLFGNININKIIPNSQLAIPSVTKTVSYNATSTDGLILYDTSGGARTLGLYSAVSNPGLSLKIRKTSSDTNPLTIVAFGAENIIAESTAATTTINTQLEEISILSDGANWQMINRDYPRGWINGSAIAISATTTSPTKGSGLQSDTAYYRRIGNTMVVRVEYHQTTAGGTGNGTYLLQIPGGWFIDSSLVMLDTSTSTGNNPMNNSVGTMTVTSGTDTLYGHVIAYDTTHITVQGIGASATQGFWGSGFLSFGSTLLSANGIFEVPIAGWH